MRRLIAISAALSLLLLGAAPASAATEVGGTCVADDSEKEWTILPLARAGSPNPLAMPARGVLTAWRIDVAAGDRLGLHGTVETFFCDKLDSDSSALFDGALPPGSTQTFEPKEKLGTPVRAIVEPDADGDGHGDETQDGCPQSGAHQAGCPVVSPEVNLTTRRTVRRKAILVRVGVSSEATVRVTGQVAWQVRQPKARGGGNRGLIVGLSAGRERIVVPGQTATFRVRLPKVVKRRLSRLDKQQGLRPKMTVLATDSAGRIASRVFWVRLPGYRPV